MNSYVAPVSDAVKTENYSNSACASESQPPPSFGQVASNFESYEPTAPPPEAFVFDSVPSDYIIYPHTCPPWTPSHAKYKIENGGDIYSKDPLLESNKDELWHFFLTHLSSSPTACIHAEGYHMETEYVQVSVKDAHGNTQFETRAKEVKVIDFSFSIDVSPYVQKQWSAIAVIPEKDGRYQRFNDILETYSSSKNSLKQICIRKKIEWDVRSVVDMVYNVIRFSGFTRKVDVHVSTNGDKIKVLSASDMSALANSSFVRCLCVLSCCCIIFGPMYLMRRHKMDNNIVAKYPVMISVEQLYARNYWPIYAAVKERVKGRTWIG
ncbi:hypothetical protein ROZALSC1DRAFT_27989 [Rozella allomycis CSF55]|uniref:Uncharacterized protein n=1 Tax=Rozella allomycis (strain CSF55) TaxID=988480 RepID=A0A4P9YMU6_ROZAC|nr:hypothetical protein ROZALSC1DRAFT_27989 [Rozella allomycis CSF55]